MVELKYIFCFEEKKDFFVPFVKVDFVKCHSLYYSNQFSKVYYVKLKFANNYPQMQT